MEHIQLDALVKPDDAGPHREALLAVGNLRLNHHTLRAGQKLHAHVHNDLDKVFLVERGALRVEVGGEERTLRRGELTLVPAGATHGAVNESEEDATLLVFVALRAKA